MKYIEIVDGLIIGCYDENSNGIPVSCIPIEDGSWQEALNINANYYKDGKFIVKDSRTLDEKISAYLDKLKINLNYEAPTTYLGIDWVGGYESAQMLNAKRTLCLEVGLESCTFTDAKDVDHALTLVEAKEVCIAVAAEFETRRAAYKTQKRVIEACTTIEEFEASKL